MYALTSAAAFLAAAFQGSPPLAREAYNRGVELQKKGDLQGAKAAYEASLRLEPDRVETLANLGAVLLQSGRDREAADRFHKSLQLRPGLDPIRVLYGVALFRTGRTDDAAAQARQVLDRQPKNPQALHLLGLCQLRRDELQEGMGSLEESLRLTPGNVDAAATLATAYVGIGRLQDARALLEGPLGASTRAEAPFVRGIVEKAQGNWVPAARLLEEALKRDPKLPTAHTELGHAYLLMGEHSRAEEQFLLELKLRQSDFHASVYMGWTLLRDRRFREALTHLRAASRSKPGHPGLLYLTGQAEYSLGNLDAALADLQASVKHHPDFLPAHVLLARVYAKMNRRDDVRRQQDIITQLTQAEQERNLGSRQSYGSHETQSLPELRSPPAARSPQ